ncbi:MULTISPECIES: hypothetical protein [Uliginosibacterium]|uniref:Uncharacterized protein n=1 Tax=Uliginosibacterium aquaticum TaxID=2731212 RepID=A0ABX2IH93_9RHOO|nr:MULTISPECIES: hypothetical protein [Uliginosibacterium]MDO6387131.1 hypothetical protein [Uliginosibacterium sp. 31-12]NSL56106.1 hypothetical protein [Uliginosibacterium aquaticum]
MKLAHPVHIPHGLHFTLSDRSRKILVAILSTLAPYALAALGVFVYHEQYGL